MRTLLLNDVVFVQKLLLSTNSKLDSSAISKLIGDLSVEIGHLGGVE